MTHAPVESGRGGYYPGYVFQPTWTEKRRPALFARRFRERDPAEKPIVLLPEAASVEVLDYGDGALQVQFGGGGVWAAGYLDSVEREDVSAAGAEEE